MLGKALDEPLTWALESCNEVPTKFLESVLDEVAFCAEECITHPAWTLSSGKAAGSAPISGGCPTTAVEHAILIKSSASSGDREEEESSELPGSLFPVGTTSDGISPHSRSKEGSGFLP